MVSVFLHGPQAAVKMSVTFYAFHKSWIPKRTVSNNSGSTVGRGQQIQYLDVRSRTCQHSLPWDQLILWTEWYSVTLLEGKYLRKQLDKHTQHTMSLSPIRVREKSRDCSNMTLLLRH